MSENLENKYRAALALLAKGRDRMVEGLAEEILDQGDDLIDEGFRFNEFLETQGTRIHFLTMLMCQLEQSAEALDEARSMAHAPPPAPPRPARRPRARSKKVQERVPGEETPDDL